MKDRNRQSGYTLIEILVVLVIITILAGVVGIKLVNTPGQARVAAAKLTINQFRSALKIYRIEQGKYPTENQGLEALVEKPTQAPVPDEYPDGGYLDTLKLPTDPWNTPYIYLVPGSHGEAFEIICYGADGEPGGTGEDEDLSSSQLD